MLSEIQTEELKSIPEAEAVTAAPAEENAKAPEADTTEAKAEKLVPLAALHEERQTRKQIQNEIRQMREQQAQRDQQIAEQQEAYAIAQQRLQQYIASMNRPPPPDENSDPLAAGLHIAKQTQNEVQALRQQQAHREQWEYQQRLQAQQNEMQRQAQDQFVATVTGSEQQFTAEHPDYFDAVKFAVSRRMKELVAGGWQQEEAAQVATNDARNMAAQWVQRGQNPAAMAYQLSQAMGYVPKTSDVAKMEMQERGMQAAKPTGGGKPTGKLTASHIANMTPTELARLSNEDFEAAMSR